MAVRIGFIGTGGISISHLRNLVKYEPAEVVALCDLSTEIIENTREAVNKAVGEQGYKLDAKPYTDYRTMLRQENLDAVFICVPPFAHGEPEEAVIDAGLHMLVEKPIALSYPLASGILSKVKQKGLLTVAAYQLRYGDHLKKVQELLAERTIAMAAVMRFGGLPGVGWYHLQNKSGGQLVEMATHQLDLLRYLIGEIDTVYAAAANRLGDFIRPGIDIFDVNCMSLKFANGAVANFANNVISKHGAPAGAAGLHIFCDGLTISIGNTVNVITAENKYEIPIDWDVMRKQDEAFVQAIISSDASLIKSDYASGLKTLAATLAAEKSARSGQALSIADFIQQATE